MAAAIVWTKLKGEKNANQALLAAARQRAGVARELHDVGAHALTVVCLQAGAAQRVWTRDPDQARAALQTVVDLATASLSHLQGSLAGLAGDSAPGRADLTELEALAGLGRALGLEVTVHVESDVRMLPAGVTRVAHRAVQEALTNAARYAPRARVDVRLRCGDDELRVDVRDSGAGPAAATSVADVTGSGLGLRGMRERVEGFGGSLTCGPTAEGGFAVAVRLPLAVPVRT